MRWHAADIESTASPSVGPDGTIYTSVRDYLYLAALDPVTGSVKWQWEYGDLAKKALAEQPGWKPTSDKVKTVALLDTVRTLSANQLWTVLSVGYAYEAWNGTLLIQPRLGVLIAVNPMDGSLLSSTRLRETAGGTVSLGADGALYVSHAAIVSSIFFYAVNPFLPEWLRIEGPPVAGISALRPGSYVELATTEIAWVQDRQEMVSTALSQQDFEQLTGIVDQMLLQLCATAPSVLNAQMQQEIDSFPAQE